MVMRSHGVQFKKLGEEETNLSGNLLLAPTAFGQETIDRVADWLGFKDGTRYIETLDRERGFIFRRATY